MGKNRVFVGGTCADTTWREELMKDLEVDYINNDVTYSTVLLNAYFSN